MTCTATRHGTAYAYSKGCRCLTATVAKTRSNKQSALRILSGQPGLVDATGTRRRIQALHAVGWRAEDLAQHLGVSAAAVRQLKWRPTVQRRTATTVAAMYDSLADCDGPSRVLAAKAKGWGWLVPLWWDDDTIDDPTFDPLVEYADPPPLSREDQRANQRAEVHRLTDLGWSSQRIADHLGCSTRHVGRLRSETLQAAS